MRALQLTDWKTDPVLTEVEDPIPGPGQVVVRVGGAGACHSDLHLMRDFSSGMIPWNFPFTLGHENAGWVAALGAGVSGLDVGQPVAVYGPWGCGSCIRCGVGMETLCENQGAAPVISGGCGLGLDGGMADLLLVPSARHLVPLPDGLDPVAAAPLTDAGLTPYHAVRRSWAKLPPGSTAVVIGVGGLGHLCIQILKATTAAQIVAVDSRVEARELALQCGADHALAPDEGVAAVRDLSGGRGADVVIDLVGSEPTMALGIRVIRPLGDLTIVGIGGGTLSFSFFAVPYEVSVQTTYWGTRPELVEVLELGARGHLNARVTTFPLEQAVDAYRRMEEGTLEGRAVIVP
jgi:propanol-preferring alcohol dehydrogenase